MSCIKLLHLALPNWLNEWIFLPRLGIQRKLWKWSHILVRFNVGYKNNNSQSNFDFTQWFNSLGVSKYCILGWDIFHCRMRDKSSMFFSPVNKNMTFLHMQFLLLSWIEWHHQNFMFPSRHYWSTMAQQDPAGPQ